MSIPARRTKTELRSGAQAKGRPPGAQAVETSAAEESMLLGEVAPGFSVVNGLDAPEAARGRDDDSQMN